MPKVSWPPIAASLTLLSVGVTLIVNRRVVAGSVAIFIGVIVAATYTRAEIRSRRSAQAMADWLIEAAQYGTKYIQNATDHDVSDARDVPRLCERHTRWLNVIKAFASEYFHSSDGDHIAWFHTYNSKGLRGFNADHEKIRNWTSERVDRLRFVARRLQDGQTTLKRLYRPH